MVWRCRRPWICHTVRDFFINRDVHVIFPSKRGITLRNLRPVNISAIRRNNKKWTNSFLANDLLDVNESPTGCEIRAGRQTVTPPRSESCIIVVLQLAGLRLIEANPLTKEGRKFLFARGVVSSLPSVPFYDLMTSSCTKQVHEPKRVVIARGTISWRYWSSLADPWNRQRTKVKVMRFINLTKAKNRGCKSMKTSRKMSKNNSNRTGVTKSRLSTRTSSLTVNASRCYPTLHWFVTGTSAELILRNIELSYSQNTPNRSILRPTERVQQPLRLKKKKATKFCREDLWSQLRHNGQYEECSRRRKTYPYISAWISAN